MPLLPIPSCLFQLCAEITEIDIFLLTPELCFFLFILFWNLIVVFDFRWHDTCLFYFVCVTDRNMYLVRYSIIMYMLFPFCCLHSSLLGYVFIINHTYTFLLSIDLLIISQLIPISRLCFMYVVLCVSLHIVAPSVLHSSSFPISIP